MKKSLFWLAVVCFSVITGLSNAQGDRQLFFTFLNPDPAKAMTTGSQGTDLRQQHEQYVSNLMNEKTVKADGKTEKSGYILIVQATDIEQADKIVEKDPLVVSGIYTPETFPLTVANNWVCGPKKPYQPVQYQLVRLIFNEDYFGDLDKMARENRIFMSNLNNNNDFVMMQGNFSIYNEGVLILNVPTKEEAEKIIKKNPAVKEGQILYDITTLTIAKGTFCRP